MEMMFLTLTKTAAEEEGVLLFGCLCVVVAPVVSGRVCLLMQSKLLLYNTVML